MSERRGTKALELWCRRVADGYKDVKITNMSTSWRDGLAFCAIIHNFRPDLIDFASLSKDNVYYNNELAFTIAEQHLNIPSLLDPADMVKYEVPDRFSILTYLSQYYRVFSNQEPASNKKAADKDTKPDDLNAKIMASIPAFVGVPKRASCNRCSNPIFLAERISFGAKSYHRSCLKCARCGAQLTVGSFYETETDGEYCCETCPDEEIQLEQRRESPPSSECSSRSSSVPGNAPPVVPAVNLSKNIRSSKLLDRISFFESAPLSDEEKSSNLERKTRMSNYLKDTLNVEEKNIDEPPDLPKSEPPSSLISRSETTENVQTVEQANVIELDNAEDEFEKLVQNLDKEDLEKEANELPEVISDPIQNLKKHTVENETETPSQTVSEDKETEKVEVSNANPESILSINTVPEVVTEELNDEAIKPVQQIELKQNLESNSDHKETVYQEKGEPSCEALAEEKVAKTTNDFEIEEKVLDKPEITKIQDESSIEISSNILTNDTETGKTQMESGSPSELTSNSVTNESIVPEEIKSTELKVLPSEEEAEESIERITEETNTDTVTECKVPVEAKVTTPFETVESCNKVEISGKEDVNKETNEEQYPSDLNPFGEDEQNEDNESVMELPNIPVGEKPIPIIRRVSKNPFGSEDEDEELSQSPSSKPPRPPPPKVKTDGAAAPSNPVPANPFGEDDDDEAPTDEPEIVPVVSKPSPRRTPVPTPRKAHAYNDSISSLDNSLMSSSKLSSSNVSLASSLESGPSSIVAPRRKKGKAPDIPVQLSGSSIVPFQQLTSSEVDKTSMDNISNSSGSGTLTTPRKKRLAPAPPPTPNASSTPKQPPKQDGGLTRAPSQRLLAVDASLRRNSELEPSSSMSRGASNESVVYRRTIVPLLLDDDGPESPNHDSMNTSERQWEKMKDNKEAQNRNRQSQSSPTSEGNGMNFGSSSAGLSILANKSSQGKWKRRKGPAPALPMMTAPPPERKPIKMLPLKEIHQELQIIETQQQGLEKQGIVLETMIRERCEGGEADIDLDIRLQSNSKEVEDLIMQLFELVNEKNELFRRQAELMYLRRMHRLEQEQADLEYEIRLLMAQPERNKTDSDKEKEEALIARLVEIVQLRNEVVECLDMDRIREAEEDLSIKQSIEERAASQQSKHGNSKKDSSTGSSSLPLTDAEKRDSSTKLSKKEKKKLKEAKKLVKSKKIDSEKDADETESSTTKEKKKKRKFLF
ncbi:MICAL-like protein 1 [Anopheles nili]|uniref:MICAL-like protein 1 n=1 Tax=Anopheles nili TaxID=185578 RepID=UPI00237BC7E4|nr:MICAL-like protein 1 [Anopheles nili]